ncbi:quinol:cytochrome C oxidoreductase [Flavihumibacter rivuli]|uniref:quinol:cytochrome C oxidoreductase n=1 Tax=Flavihumibacter rivuli TaxID=2838156 RepID=UPI001BDE721A|nr:quinol:cytochrome C oxidoreductase [Flavihumibacter rivuli]ULQ55534.1 quinol:cytochrome C oxidoreductase [Flavihumibacter rivuli]
MSFREQFEIPAKYKMWSMILMGVGLVSILAGYFLYGAGDEHHQARFWGTMLFNSVFFLLVVNASMFFICATTLAMGGWQMAFRRVPEAISTAVIPLGIIALVVLLALVLGHQHHIYHWLTPGDDKILLGKSGFLNPTFFIVWTVLTIGLWIILGAKMRSLSRELDEKGPLTVEEGRKYIFKNTIWGSLFLVWFALTVASVTPWLWLMSIDAHWYSTMYSWYTFASSFVAGMSLVTLFVIYLKNKGYLELVNQEHLHDLGKFMFAFSVFWTYLWFSQYMLIWYANIPEETVYFKHRVQGPYRGIFFLNLIVNFLAPLLILMRRSSKRNYTLLVFMAVLIIFGHWVDFYQMVMASVSKEHVELNLFDFGVAAGFIGIIMWSAGNALSKHSLIAKNHPFFKESVIHHT